MVCKEVLSVKEKGRDGQTVVRQEEKNTGYQQVSVEIKTQAVLAATSLLGPEKRAAWVCSPSFPFPSPPSFFMNQRWNPGLHAQESTIEPHSRPMSSIATKSPKHLQLSILASGNRNAEQNASNLEPSTFPFSGFGLHFPTSLSLCLSF